MTSSRPRVLFVSHRADWTGPAASLMLLLKHLHSRCDVAVLLPGSGPLTEALEGERIPFFTMRSLGKWNVPAIASLIRQERFDLVYGNSQCGAARNALIAAKLAGRPFICHARGIEWGKSWLRLGFLRFADAVVAVSEACGASVARFVSGGRLHIVSNGAEINRFMGDRSANRIQLLAEMGLPKESLILINVAHIARHKGQRDAIKGLAYLLESVPQAHLLLVGHLNRDEAYVGEVRAAIEDQGLQGHVTLTGFRRDIPELLTAADIYVHPSTRDAHPRAVIEAMAAGLPVAAFATDGVTETVADGKTGYLVPKEESSALGDAITRLALDPELRQQMGTSGRLRAQEHFSAEVTARKVADVIDGVLSRPALPDKAAVSTAERLWPH